MLNHIDIMGRLTKDPELRHTQDGTGVSSFSIACEQDRPSKDGTKQVDYIDIVCWNKTAEFASRYFKKGQLVAISGRLQNRDWTDKDGNKRRTAEVIASACYFAEGKREAAPSVTFQDVSVEDGELPF